MENNRQMPAPTDMPELKVPEQREVAQVSKKAHHQAHQPEEVTRGPIPVVAIADGYYNNYRLKEGDAFMIQSEEDLGFWMKASDPQIQARHAANESKARAKIKEARQLQMKKSEAGE